MISGIGWTILTAIVGQGPVPDAGEQSFAMYAAYALLAGAIALIGGLLKHSAETNTYIRATLMAQAQAVVVALTANEATIEKMAEALTKSNDSIARLVMIIEGERHREHRDREGKKTD